MSGFLLRALQDYILANFDPASWDRIIAATGAPPEGFEPLMPYKIEVLRKTLSHCARELDRPVPVILEDLGTWVIAAGYNGAARRLLRFCGADFLDFLYSLVELPDRARLALPDLSLPNFSLEERGGGLYRLNCSDGLQELSWIMLGALRAMADDYGALVLIEEESCHDGRTIALSIRLLESHFTESRAFDLTRQSPRGARAMRQNRVFSTILRPDQRGDRPDQGVPDATGKASRNGRAIAPAKGVGAADRGGGVATIAQAPPAARAGPLGPLRPPLAPARPDSGEGGALTAGAPGTSLTLSHAAFNQMLPLHLILSETGKILAVGSLIQRMFPGEELIGSPLLRHFRLRVTGQSSGPPMLPLGAGLRVRLQQRPDGLRLRGMTLALGAGEGLLMVFSFGIDILRAVEALNLTDDDFAATDMAMELLCLTEANGLVMGEMRALSRRLDEARRQAEDEALTDALTGLRNRRAADLFLTRICREGGPFAVMQLDLDFFKQVNDRNGHAAGDEVLIHVAAVLARLLRSKDCIARVGGDEFLAILPGLEPSRRLDDLAEQLITQIARPVLWRDAVCRVSVSIGLVTVPAGETPHPADLLAEADKALYAAKADGRGRVSIAARQRVSPDGAAPARDPAPSHPAPLKIRERQK